MGRLFLHRLSLKSIISPTDLFPTLSHLRISRACLDSGPDSAKCPHGPGHLRPGQAHHPPGQVVRIYLAEAAVQTGQQIQYFEITIPVVRIRTVSLSLFVNTL